MPALSLQSLYHAYGAEPVLDRVEWQLHTEERICLVGRNGEGKSTLLRLLAGLETPDQGVVGWSDDTVIGYVPQALPTPSDQSIRHFVLQGAGERGQRLLEYEAALEHAPEAATTSNLQQWLDDHMVWDLAQQADAVMSQFSLDPQSALRTLSGGWRRKALVARALVCQPNVLLLDEPTNHLDIDSIEWLEQFLRSFRGLVIFISHDRQFIDAAAEVIVELDRSVLYRYPAPYDAFLNAREDRLRIETEQNARFDRKLAQEEAWIRQGIKARRTRNEGRVRRLQALRQQRQQRRELAGPARMELQAAEQSGKLVFELQDLTFSYNGDPIVKNLTTEVMRGDTVALLGPNGVGKTTLVRLLLGQLQPTSGKVETGTRLQVAYFDQGRHQLDPDRSVMDTLSEGREFIEVNGQRIHVVSWLERFLFSPRQARSPVRTLSGGEANRLLLARLFSQPANLLVLDEPTNDLDLDTLELLEELIVDFPGTTLVISHDRYFIDHVATRVWGFQGNGEVTTLVGGYQEWHEYQQRQATAQALTQGAKATPAVSTPAGQQKAASRTQRVSSRSGKLSYRDKREYEALPGKIEALEQDIAALTKQTGDPAFYQGDPQEVEATLRTLTEQQQALDAALERWMELEEQVTG